MARRKDRGDRQAPLLDLQRKIQGNSLMRIAASLALPLIIVASQALAQAPGACETAPTVSCVLALAREAAGTDTDQLAVIADVYVQAGDKVAAADVARKVVAGLEEDVGQKGMRITPDEARNQVLLFTFIANLYSRLGETSAAKSLLERAQKLAATIADSQMRAETLANVPEALARAGDMSGALALVDRLSAGRTAQSSAAPALVACSPDASATLRPVLDDETNWLRAGSPGAAGTPSDMRKRLAVVVLRRGDLTGALSIAKAITDPHHCFDFLTQYVEACARAGDDAGAMAVANTLRSALLRSQVMERLAAVRAGVGDIDGALGILRRIPDTETRYSMIAKLALRWALRDPAAALAILEADVPDPLGNRTMVARIVIAIESAKTNGLPAQVILASLHEKFQRETDPIKRGMLLGSLGGAYARALDAGGVAAIVRTLDQPDERVILLALLATELAVAGRRLPGMQALTEAREIADAIVDPSMRGAIEPAIVRALAANGGVSVARERIASQPPAIQAEILTPIIETLSAMREYGSALRMAADIANPQERADLFIMIARSLAGSSR
jgi:hypothetical protein